MKITKLHIAFCLTFSLVLSACNSSISADKISSANNVSSIQVQPNPTPQLNSEDERADIVQLIIDLPELQSYYHDDTVANRKPLIILKNEILTREIPLSKFGEPVKFADCDELKKTNKPYLEFTVLEVKENAATVVFRYRVEGVEGRLTLNKQSGIWQIQKQQLVEVKFADKGCNSDKKSQN